MEQNQQQEEFIQKHFLNLSNELITKETIEKIVNGLFEKINIRRSIYRTSVSEPYYIPEFKVNNIEHYRRAFSHKSFIIEQNILEDRGTLQVYQELYSELKELEAKFPSKEQEFSLIQNSEEENKNPVRIGELESYILNLDPTYTRKKFKEWVNSGVSTLYYRTKQSYERYEFLGDSILKTIQGKYIFHRYPGRSGKATESEHAKKISENNEEFMTVLRTKIEKTEQLAKFVRYLGLEKYILISSHIENLNYNGQGRSNPSLLEDAFESLIGAIVEDKKDNSFEEEGVRYSYAHYFVVGVMEETINFSELVLKNDNFKDSLLKYISQEKWELTNRQGKRNPFEEILTYGPSNNKRFVIGVFVPMKYIPVRSKEKVLGYSKKMQSILNSDGKRNLDQILSEKNKNLNQTEIYVLVGMGTDNSKKSSEQSASKKALTNLGIPLNY